MPETPFPKTTSPDLPVVHACIVHHRGQDMLDACLRTLLASEGVDLQVVILSNCCQEPLPAIADESERVHVAVSDVSIGFSEANNAAVAHAREHLGAADYYYFLNNDTESEPRTLVHLVDALRARERGAAAGPLTLIQAAPDHLNSLGLNVTEDAWAWDEGIGRALDDYGPLPDVREVAAITGSALIVDAPSFEAVGGWTEIYDWYFEDIDLCLKLWKRGLEVIHVPESVIYHRVSATMTTGAERKFFFFWRNRLVLALVHWPPALLGRVLRWALVDEILKRPRTDNELQRRAFVGALKKLPRALRLRWRHRGPDDWRRFLHPRGSVPVITLPAATHQSSLDGTEAAPEGDVGGAEDGSEDGLVNGAEEAVEIVYRVPVETWDAFGPSDAEDGRARILVLGWGPLPFEEGRMHYAPGTRTWQMALPLAQCGHRVRIAMAHIPGSVDEPGEEGDDEPYVRSFERGGVEIFAMDRTTFEAPGHLEALVDGFRPHLLVGASPVPSKRAVDLASDCARDEAPPVWVDLFGDPMAEAQAKAARHADGSDHLGAYWDLMATVLGGGDRFSAVSHRQRLAVIGQLGLAGRLDGQAAGEELVAVVPCAAPPDILEALSSAPDPDGAEEDADSDEIRLLWSGGFNTWCDGTTLVDGLERAFDENPRLRLEVTGGAIGGQDEQTYARFEARVRKSRHRDRFRLHGQLPKEEAEAVFARAHLGIVTEKRLYERELGSSARLVGWLAAGLPFVATEQSELAAHAASEGAAAVYPVGDAEALAETIRRSTRAVDDGSDTLPLGQMAANARAYARKYLGFESTASPVVAWAWEKLAARATSAENAAEAPVGKNGRPFLRDLRSLEAEIRSVRIQGDILRTRLERAHDELDEHHRAVEAARADYHVVRAELGRIHQSRMWGLWMSYLRVRASIGRLFGRG